MAIFLKIKKLITYSLLKCTCHLLLNSRPVGRVLGSNGSLKKKKWIAFANDMRYRSLHLHPFKDRIEQVQVASRGCQG